MNLTPIEKVDGIFIKREDLFEVAGVCGGKARTCWRLMKGASGAVTSASRMSPQIEIVASIAQEMQIPCRIHTSVGKSTYECEFAESCEAEVVRHNPGHSSVLSARAREDSLKTGWRNIPFGMECWAAVEETSLQVANLPKEIKRIVVPIGSGMTVAGILHGMKDLRITVPVLGVIVGANPKRRLDKYAPSGYQHVLTLKNSPKSYSQEIHCDIGGIPLDPMYESKCFDFLSDGDLLWIVGIRNSIRSCR